MKTESVAAGADATVYSMSGIYTRVSELACFGTALALAPGIFNREPAPAPGKREQ